MAKKLKKKKKKIEISSKKKKARAQKAREIENGGFSQNFVVRSSLSTLFSPS